MRHSLWKNRRNLLILMGLIGALFAISNVAHALVTVSGDLAVDNSARVFTGDTAGTSLTFVAGVVSGPNTTQTHNFLTTDQHLYIAAWSDDSTQQGLLHDLAMNANPVWSDNPAWEVYATGNDLDGTTSPTLAQLSTQIAIANAATGGAGTSNTWVPTTVGGPNDNTFPTSNSWLIQALIPTNVNWVWYDSGQQTSLQPPFRTGFNHYEYLIFRTPIVPEPGSAVLALLGMTVCGFVPRRKRTVNNVTK